MAIFDLFSKRQKRLRGEVPDVYSYNSLPDPLRVQIVHIIEYTLGDENQCYDEYLEVSGTYNKIVKILCKEHGKFYLVETHKRDNRYCGGYIQLLNFILQEVNVEHCIDAIELSFTAIDRITRNSHYMRKNDYNKRADDAIHELNSRFKEHGIGYQFEDGQIMRIDSEHIHSEIIKPALLVLRDKRFVGANDEFLSAYEHYRHGNNKEALNAALKAFESTLKVICSIKKWSYSATDTSSKLLQICFDKGLVESFWQSHMASLRSLLESGVPTVRNRLGAHGQGEEVKEVPTHLVSFTLNSTAAAILLFAKSAGV